MDKLDIVVSAFSALLRPLVAHNSGVLISGGYHLLHKAEIMLVPFLDAFQLLVTVCLHFFGLCKNAPKHF